MASIDSTAIDTFRDRLEHHPVYHAIETLTDLRCFMEHHVYSVWDFMSLIKYLQSRFAPTTWPWVPAGDGEVRRFINELVLEEESDQTADGKSFSSHFELYLAAMSEIGADTRAPREFVRVCAEHGIETALGASITPSPSAEFTRTTFGFIATDKPHQVAAALALGREHIIPLVFRAILDRIGVSADDAPIFHYYLNRHIHLDEDFHAPLSLRLLNGLCTDADLESEAINAAQQALSARLDFWDGVHRAIKRTRNAKAA